MKPATKKKMKPARTTRKVRSRLRNFHLPLTEELYLRLAEAAKGEGEPSTALARRAIRFFLEVRGRQETRKQLRAFALQYAGTDVDYDSELAEEGILQWSAAEAGWDEKG
jgi:hypothetical protein